MLTEAISPITEEYGAVGLMAASSVDVTSNLVCAKPTSIASDSGSSSFRLPSDKRKKKWRKPKDKPKRPLSAYNLFFQIERQRLLDAGGPSPDLVNVGKNKTKSTTGATKKYGFASLARHIAAKWKDLDASAMTYYQQLADQEQVRYMKDLVQWKIHEAKQKYDTKGNDDTVPNRNGAPSQESTSQGLPIGGADDTTSIASLTTAMTNPVPVAPPQVEPSLNDCWANASSNVKCMSEEQPQQHDMNALRCMGSGLFGGGCFDDGNSNLSSIIQELANEQLHQRQHQDTDVDAATTSPSSHELLEPLPYMDFAAPMTCTDTTTGATTQTTGHSMADIFQRISTLNMLPSSFHSTAADPPSQVSTDTATVMPTPIATSTPSHSLQQLRLDLDEDEQEFLIAFLA